jgi:hypothetical protein
MQEYAQERPGRLRRWWSRLLNGENRWGFVHIQRDRFGVTRCRLVVYPPGISDVERRRLRIWRGSPIWGAALWVVAEIILQQFLGPWSALAISSTIVIVSGAVARAMIDDARTNVRTAVVITLPGHTDAATIAARDKLQAMAATLMDADERVDAKQMSPIDHEALWWQVYDQLASNRLAVSGGHRSERTA